MPDKVAAKPAVRKAATNRFVVEFGNDKLPAALADKMEVAMRRAALDVIAGLDFEAVGKFRIHPEWRGIWFEIPEIRQF